MSKPRTSTSAYAAHISHFASFAAGVVLTPALLLLMSCSSTTNAGTSTTTTTTTNAYATVYAAINWGSSATVTFPTSCTMKIVSSGVPGYHDPYYLGPVSMANPVQVASTPSGLQLAVVPYSPASIQGSSATINICPVKAATTTTTNQGAIGYIVNGEQLFNAYEATSTAALGDNVSYTFTSGGVSYTAKFIDACNSHATPVSMGYTWHYHGIPLCEAATLDGATGPSHLLGIALDGFPVYGGRDINGNVITLSQLDACNGITSPTPEFPNGAYHYVLPIGVTNGYSSMKCYSGTVSSVQMGMARRLACRNKAKISAGI